MNLLWFYVQDPSGSGGIKPIDADREIDFLETARTQNAQVQQVVPYELNLPTAGGEFVKTRKFIPLDKVSDFEQAGAENGFVNAEKYDAGGKPSFKRAADYYELPNVGGVALHRQ